METENSSLKKDNYAMQYTQMIKEQGLISEVSTVLKFQDLSVVKRTIRVFANVYRHSLQLLAAGDLDEPTFSKAWPDVQDIGNELIEMLKNSENEGIIIHIVRFLEASVMAEILSDITRYPHIASKMENIINLKIKSVKDLLSLPYVGGSAFIVGIRSLITIACYKSNIRKEVVGLIRNLIAKPPPTLFDHHVRSLNKVLQRNLFRLLRREELPEERERLINMMVKVGVPRHMLSHWVPQSSGQKRSTASDSNCDVDSDNTTNAHKKRKCAITNSNSPPLPGFSQVSLPSQPSVSHGSYALPPGSQSNVCSGSPSAMLPGLNPALPAGTLPALPPGSPPALGSPSALSPGSHAVLPPLPPVLLLGSPPPPGSASAQSHRTIPASPSGTPPPLPPCSPPPPDSSQSLQERSHSVFISDVGNLSWKDSGHPHFDELKVIFSNIRSKKTSKEEIIYDLLENSDVIELVMTCIDKISDDHVEDDLMAKLAEAGDENTMRETLSVLLIKLLPKSIIDAINCDN
ncbi:unnamed protein product [Meganyctiphanes norvegica]|uniref:Symplekin/Pta1 N-terminal domain-containing protein n=1 Tax=Meganyctiphanes norvegica TaxID=48144 RepID=A0AAV2SLB5_MEGNR